MSNDVIVPEGWIQTTLGEIGRYLNGRAFKTSEWSKEGRPIIRIQDLTGSNRNPNYFAGEVEERYVVWPGDLLISWSATLGAYIWDGPEAVLNQHIFKVQSDINRRFHYHLVRDRLAELMRSTHGSGMVHVTKGTFDNTPVAIPESEFVQEQIAHAIDAAEAKQRSASVHLAVARRAVERFRQSVLAAACSGRLTADWRGGNVALEAAEALISRSTRKLEAGKHAPASQEKWTAPDWLELPNTWRWAPLKELAIIRGGIQKQPKRTPRNNAYPYLRVANVLRDKLDLSEIKRFELFDREIEIYRLERGDLLVVEGNGSGKEIGRCAIWRGEIPDCVHQNHIIRVRCIEMDPVFVSLFWNSPIGAQEIASLAVTTAGLYSLSTKKVASVLVPVPPLEEQREVVRRSAQLLKIASGLDAKFAVIAHHLERCSQAVLTRAFRGEFNFDAQEG